VLGLNGSGKSSLLKIMAGIDKDIQGEAVPMPNLNIGYLPQEPQLDPEQTVREAVESALGEVFAKAKLEEVYAAYADENADFDAPKNRRVWKRSSPLLRATMLNCNWKWPLMRCACRRGMPKSACCPAVKNAALPYVVCCCPNRHVAA
jgi:ATPase subunit of ABC transporter with duplicated ATPase domains